MEKQIEPKEKALRAIYECVTIATRNGRYQQAQEMARNAKIIEAQEWKTPNLTK